MILVTFSVVVTIGVLNVNFRTPATHKMAPWVRKTFIDFLPRYLFIQRPDPDPVEEDERTELLGGDNS
jgi:nicotinic acetylcholine receptor